MKKLILIAMLALLSGCAVAPNPGFLEAERENRALEARGFSAYGPQ